MASRTLWRNKDNGASGLGPDAFEFIVQQVTSLGIERGEGLIHQQNVWFGGESAR